MGGASQRDRWLPRSCAARCLRYKSLAERNNTVLSDTQRRSVGGVRVAEEEDAVFFPLITINLDASLAALRSMKGERVDIHSGSGPRSVSLDDVFWMFWGFVSFFEGDKEMQPCPAVVL